MKTWILIADASQARLFDTPNRLSKMHLLKEFAHPTSRKRDSELVSSPPGSVGKGRMHGGFPPHTSPHETEVARFAQEVAEALNKGCLERAFVRLILACPPHFLGLLKKNLNDSTLKLLATAVDRDFTRLDVKDLVLSLEKYM